MRFVRERLEVVMLYSSNWGGESASEGASAVVRLFSMKKLGEITKTASGSGFYILPNTIITNSHVANEIESIGKVNAYNNSWNINSTISGMPKKLETLFSGKAIKYFQMEKSFPVTQNWVGRDPITTTVGNFDFFDITAMNFSGSPNKVFFIPSPRILQPNDEIITLSYPGDENKPPFSSSQNYVDWAPSESFLKDNIFNGYGTLCASVGKILHPYDFTQNGLVEKVEDFCYDKSNQECLASSESLIFGSSGGVMISKFSKVYHIKGYTLIEFHAVHTGGEF
ncbi:predicted protein, partial [Naegleria gruberi]